MNGRNYQGKIMILEKKPKFLKLFVCKHIMRLSSGKHGTGNEFTNPNFIGRKLVMFSIFSKF